MFSGAIERAFRTPPPTATATDLIDTTVTLLLSRNFTHWEPCLEHFLTDVPHARLCTTYQKKGIREIARLGGAWVALRSYGTMTARIHLMMVSYGTALYSGRASSGIFDFDL